jgi:translation machinery-associated protein 16
LLIRYFHRFDEELDQINTKNSIGKRHIGQNFSREKSIEMTLNAEKNEYETSGIGKKNSTLFTKF